MPRFVVPTRQLGLALAALGLIAVSAGRSGAGEGVLTSTPQTVPGGVVVYRPAYPAQRPRPVFLSNYAGVDYSAPRTVAPTVRRVRFFGWLRPYP